MNGSFYSRFGRPIVIVFLILLPPTVWTAVRTLESTTNEARDWLPGHYEETIEYEWFTRHFGEDDFVLVTWEGCRLDDPRLAKFAAAMDDEVQRSAGGKSPFRRIVTGRRLLDELTDPPLRLEREEAVARLRGTLIGLDGEQTCALVHLAEAGIADLGGSIEQIRMTTLACGVPRDALRLGGLPVVNEAINRAGIETLMRELGLAGVVGVAVAWTLFRTLKLTVAVAVSGLYGAVAALAMVRLAGVSMNSILVTMAPLVFVAATSGAIHLANYYRDETARAGRAGAAERAVRHAWTPLGLATATTAVGLLSLLYSDLLPIRQFGLFSAVGVVLAWALTLLFLPAVIEVWPFPDRGAVTAEASPAARSWSGLAAFVLRHPTWFSLLGLGLIAVGGAAIGRMRTSVDVMRHFPVGTPILEEYVWLEQRMGYLMPVEVVVRFPDEPTGPSFLEKMECVGDIEQALRTVPRVGSSLSAATFLPDTSRGFGSPWLRRSVAEKRLVGRRERLQEHGLLTRGDGEELWRITLRVGPFIDLDYERLLGDLRARAAALPGPSASRPAFTLSFTGVMPVIHKARVSLLGDLLFGLGTDLLLIFVAMVVLMRHWSSGVLLLLVSVLPTAVVFGSLVHLGIVVEIGALMAPCVALGVTVDDVIHFLLWFRRGIRQGLDRRQAVLLAYDGCARAMVQSWAVLGLGLCMVLFSSFLPNIHFGAAMVALLTVGLAGNLLFLPALLVGPLGGVIARRVTR